MNKNKFIDAANQYGLSVEIAIISIIAIKYYGSLEFLKMFKKLDIRNELIKKYEKEKHLKKLKSFNSDFIEH